MKSSGSTSFSLFPIQDSPPLQVVEGFVLSAELFQGCFVRQMWDWSVPGWSLSLVSTQFTWRHQLYWRVEVKGQGQGVKGSGQDVVGGNWKEWEEYSCLNRDVVGPGNDATPFQSLCGSFGLLSWELSTRHDSVGCVI